jgi:hypothetical protein
MPVAIVYLRVAATVVCQPEKCHPCARWEFGLCAANRWSRSRMSWVRVTTLVVQLFSAKQLPAALWRQEDIAVHSSHYAMARVCVAQGSVHILFFLHTAHVSATVYGLLNLFSLKKMLHFS